MESSEAPARVVAVTLGVAIAKSVWPAFQEWGESVCHVQTWVVATSVAEIKASSVLVVDSKDASADCEVAQRLLTTADVAMVVPTELDAKLDSSADLDRDELPRIAVADQVAKTVLVAALPDSAVVSADWEVAWETDAVVVEVVAWDRGAELGCTHTVVKSHTLPMHLTPAGWPLNTLTLTTRLEVHVTSCRTIQCPSDDKLQPNIKRIIPVEALVKNTSIESRESYPSG